MLGREGRSGERACLQSGRSPTSKMRGTVYHARMRLGFGRGCVIADRAMRSTVRELGTGRGGLVTRSARSVGTELAESRICFPRKLGAHLHWPTAPDPSFEPTDIHTCTEYRLMRQTNISLSFDRLTVISLSLIDQCWVCQKKSQFLQTDTY